MLREYGDPLAALRARLAEASPLSRAVLGGTAYALIALLWIYFSDDAVAALADNAAELVLFSKLKGSAFVLMMTLLVGLLIYRVECRSNDVQQTLNGLRQDHLTGLPNRTALEDHLARVCQLARERREPFVLLLVNVVDLGRINASMSRSDGDAVLHEVAQRLREIARAGDLVARLESDTFAVVLRPRTERPSARGFVHRLITRFEAPLTSAGLALTVDLRLAMARAPHDGDESDLLLDAAGRAMRRAREEKLVNIAVTPGRGAATSTLQIEVALREAIRDDRITVYFQPQISLPEGRVVGAEALARWTTADGVEQSPAEFIPVAEAAGLIGSLTASILDQTLACAARWRRAGYPELRLSVNLSGLDLRSGRSAHAIKEALERHRVPGRNLVLEITESRFMEDPEAAIRSLEHLRALGVGIAIDDFGTGYSSLSYLIRFPIDTLKIDRSFVSRADITPEKHAILDTICRMAHALSLDSLAEGVETMAEARVVAGLGCRHMQGYLASPPLPPEEFEKRFLASGGTILPQISKALLQSPRARRRG